MLAGEGWHPGVIGIVASRHRRAPPPARRADRARRRGGHGLGPLDPGVRPARRADACAEHLARHGGHRAAAGCTIARGDVDAFRAAFDAHAAAALRPEDLVPARARGRGRRRRRARARRWPRSSRRSRRSASATPPSRCSCPAARLADPRPMGEGKHVRFTVAVRRRRARGPSRSARRGCRRRRRPARRDVRAGDQRVGRRRRAAARAAPRAARCDAGARSSVVGEPGRAVVGAALAVARRRRCRCAGARACPPRRAGLAAARRARPRPPRRRRSPATSPRSSHTGEPVLVVVADAALARAQLAADRRRLRAVLARALRADPRRSPRRTPTSSSLDPPATPAAAVDLLAAVARPDGPSGLGPAELRFDCATP